ncbi:hypothetical protein AB0C86_37360 [Streptomyces lavendulae]|uniref:hypothetical protein n=1 Tax=Streptomyces lavendulae TaxID=1914 RepID=UPI0033FB978E
MKIAVAHCPELEALAGHIRSFGQMLTRREGHLTQEWIAAVRADDLSGLHSFANGLERDLAAVVAGALHSLELRRRRRPRQPNQDDVE